SPHGSAVSDVLAESFVKYKAANATAVTVATTATATARWVVLVIPSHIRSCHARTSHSPAAVLRAPARCAIPERRRLRLASALLQEREQLSVDLVGSLEVRQVRRLGHDHESSAADGVGD